MTFPLGSLGADGAAAARGAAPMEAPPAWRQKLQLTAGAIVWLLFVLAMVTHHASDVAFTTSGTGEETRNKAGLLGAYVSDLAYFLFGFSAWWLVPVGFRTWLSALARLLRGGESPEPARPRLLFWAGLALLFMASTALEWTRLYRFEGEIGRAHV